MDALNIGTKVENEGKNSQGMLSAEEFNELVNAVKALIGNNVEGLQGKLTAINNRLEELAGQGGGGGASAEELAGLRKLIDEVAKSALVTGTTEGTAYDGAAGSALEQIVRELAGGAGTMYSVYVRNNMDSLGFATQYGEPCVLDFTFVSQYRDDVAEPYKPTGELGVCTVMIKNAKYTDFTVITQMEVSSGIAVRQEISEHLSAGSNSVKITVKGENTDKTTAPVTYTVQLTSVTSNFAASHFRKDKYVILRNLYFIENGCRKDQRRVCSLASNSRPSSPWPEQAPDSKKAGTSYW